MDFDEILKKVLYTIYLREEIVLENYPISLTVDKIVEETGIEKPLVINALYKLEEKDLIKLVRYNGRIEEIKPIREKTLYVVLWYIVDELKKLNKNKGD